MAASVAPAPNTVWLAFRYRSHPLHPCAASASVSRPWLSGTKSAALTFFGYPLSRRLHHLREAELPALDDVKAQVLRHLIRRGPLESRPRIQGLAALVIRHGGVAVRHRPQ